jgi:hypothetical protein
VSILYAKAGNWWHDQCRRNRPESWLAMQDTYNLAVAKRSIVLKTVKKIDLQVA